MKVWAFIKEHFTMIPMDSQNRMIRLGAGLHEGTPFIRLDLWWVGFRIS